MSNAAATPRTRRPRTAAGSTPPQIALDVARLTACSTWVSETLDCCAEVTVRDVTSLLLPALTERLHVPLVDVAVETLVDFVAAHLDVHRTHTASDNTTGDTSGDTIGEAACLWTWLTPGRVETALRELFTNLTSEVTLDEAIASAVAADIDGELLCWNVINRESVKHEGLIHKECNRLARTLPDRRPEDLKGYGWVGLRVALRNYDPSLGYAFSTYACPKINGAIRDGVRAESPIPKRLTTFVRKVTAAEEALTQQLGRSPSYAEIAEYLQENITAMALLPRLRDTASIEEMSNPWGEKTREPACLVDASAPEDEVVISLRNQALRRAVDDLPEDEATAVRLLMLEEMPVGEAAAMVGVEPRQLRMRKQRGMRTLAPIMRAWLDEHVPA